MKDLSHLNVMGLTGVCINAGPAPLVILPYMAGGSLLCYLKRNRDTILLIGDHTNQEKETELHLLSVCLQIARGMEYISSKSLVHRDLAARNCLIDHQGIIKVADFGLSSKLYDKVYVRQNMTEGIKLPIKWMAIESITDRIFSEKTDVWSFGVTCWEVFSGGKEPYGGIMPMAILKLLEQGQRMDKPNNNACSINTYENLMMACWSSSPDDRLMHICSDCHHYRKYTNSNG
jgi:serine/threonine protein kinase